MISDETSKRSDRCLLFLLIIPKLSMDRRVVGDDNSILLVIINSGNAIAGDARHGREIAPPTTSPNVGFRKLRSLETLGNMRVLGMK
jgi:hypothetical protein